MTQLRALFEAYDQAIAAHAPYINWEFRLIFSRRNAPAEFPYVYHSGTEQLTPVFPTYTVWPGTVAIDRRHMMQLWHNGVDVRVVLWNNSRNKVEIEYFNSEDNDTRIPMPGQLAQIRQHEQTSS